MKQVFIAIIAFVLIGCGNANATNNESTTEESNSTFKYTYIDPVQINLDDMPFVEAFRIQHRAKGEGDVFWWRGVLYTTDLAESINTNKGGWVQNNDDPDDYCFYNRRDECGVCNGTGKSFWWRDKDGDGLGDHRESILSCTDPNVDPINLGDLD